MDDRRTNWPLTIFLLIVSAPILIMYVWLFIDSVSEINIESIWPKKFTLRNWRFLTENYYGNLRYGFGATLAVVLVAVGIALSLLYLRLFDFKKLVAEPLIEN